VLRLEPELEDRLNKVGMKLYSYKAPFLKGLIIEALEKKEYKQLKKKLMEKQLEEGGISKDD